MASHRVLSALANPPAKMILMRVAILGTGYVGLTTGVCLSYLGHEVTCVDTDATKIDLLKSGKPPIYERGLEELLGRVDITFSVDPGEAVSQAEIVFVAVGTPPQADGSPDLRYLRSAAHSISQFLGDHFTVVVNKSTVPIGSGNWVESLVRKSQPAGRFAVASNPEFLREGSALADSFYPDRIVIGADSSEARQMLEALYEPIIQQSFAPPPLLPRPDGLVTVPIVSSDLASAELIKYAANAFLALKISFINEIGNLAERVGADVREVARGIGLDSRIGSKFLQAGIGWGGSCFGKDTAALIATAAEYGLGMPIVSAARDINQRQRIRVIEKLLAELKVLKGRRIALLGLAFKPFTDDLREAPAIDIARRLAQHGCSVAAHDPVAMDRFRREFPNEDVTLADSAEEALQGADATVLVTEWPEYLNLDWDGLKPSMRTPLVVDGRNFLDSARLRSAGLRVVSIP